MDPLFIGNHPAIDFLNTTFVSGHQPVEFIGSGPDYLDWLVRSKSIDLSNAETLKLQFAPADIEAAAEEAREIRSWLRDWLQRWLEKPQGKFPDDVARLNELMSRVVYLRRLVWDDDPRVADDPHFKSARHLVGLIAVQFAELITKEAPLFIRQCAGEHCTLWFLDNSKSHRRLFCSPAVCGNRAKVSAFRKRGRG